MTADLLPIITTVVAAHFLALISPGPDFLLVVRSTLRNSRRRALGVASGDCVWRDQCQFIFWAVFVCSDVAADHCLAGDGVARGDVGAGIVQRTDLAIFMVDNQAF